MPRRTYDDYTRFSDVVRTAIGKWFLLLCGGAWLALIFEPGVTWWARCLRLLGCAILVAVAFAMNHECESVKARRKAMRSTDDA